MIDDLRKIKKQVADAQRQKAIKESKKDEIKDRLYSKAKEKKMQIEEEKITADKKELVLKHIFLVLKFASLALFFITCAFILVSVFTDKSPYKNTAVINNEEEPNELEKKTAEKFIKTVLSEYQSDGMRALTKYWHITSDEEAKFYAEELLSGLDVSSLDIRSVKKLPNSQFNVKISRNSHPISIRIIKQEYDIYLISLN